jgi:hypothetical protein
VLRSAASINSEVIGSATLRQETAERLPKTSSPM